MGGRGWRESSARGRGQGEAVAWSVGQDWCLGWRAGGREGCKVARLYCISAAVLAFARAAVSLQLCIPVIHALQYVIEDDNS